MDGRSPYLLVVYSICFMFFIAKSNAQETRAVRWELFKNLDMNWDDVLKFCHSTGGHMVTPKTTLAMHALQQQTARWFVDWPGSSSSIEDFWMGLFNCDQSNDKAENLVWEMDNSQLGEAATIWKNDLGNIEAEPCIRVQLHNNKVDVSWANRACSSTLGVVCEYDQGNCTYEAVPKKTMVPKQGMWFHKNVNDLSTCWDFCLDLRVNGTECVAAVFSSSVRLPGDCLLGLGDRLLETSDVEVCDRADSTVLLRRCFNGSVNSTEQSVLSYVLSKFSNTAGQSCPDQYTTIQYNDYNPPGAQRLSTEELTSYDAFFCMSSTTSLSLPPSTSPSLPLPTTPSASFSTSSSVPPATLSIASPATSPSALAETSSPIFQATSSKMSQSTSSTPTTVVSSTSSLNKPSSVLPATSSTASQNTRSSSAAPATSSTEFSNKSEHVLTTTISQATSSIAPSSVSPTTFTQVNSLTTEHALSTSAPDQPPGTTTQEKCPCVCRFKNNGSLPSSANETEDHQLLLIPVNETSKYRRSKISVYVERKINPGMSVAYIIFMCFFVLCILLCDLTRIRKCGKNRRFRIGQGSVETTQEEKVTRNP